ncbi:MAG: prolipoprotein diacylglyceryl transferase [Clostridiales bacterium]|nr:prolipoprotein diacylglyceryl transferase [Clostridiales bacterium]
MFPNEIIFGLTLYDILLGVAVVAAIAIFTYFSNRRKLDYRLHNFILIDTVVSVILGYGFAVLFQALWNCLETGVFELSRNTGATFLGGLVGGAAVFLGFYYLVGAAVFKDGLNRIKMPELLDCIAVCIPAAHSIGRLGCLCAGCCHGKPTDAWYGIYMVNLGRRVVPTQLFEAIFLAALAVFLFVRAVKNKRYNMPLYMAAYGIWRFPMELLRDDDRGHSFISFLTPSQLISILLIAGSAILFIVLRRAYARADARYKSEMPASAGSAGKESE